MINIGKSWVNGMTYKEIADKEITSGDGLVITRMIDRKVEELAGEEVKEREELTKRYYDEEYLQNWAKSVLRRKFTKYELGELKKIMTKEIAVLAHFYEESGGNASGNDLITGIIFFESLQEYNSINEGI